MEAEGTNGRSTVSLEENLKKALTELLVLFLLSQRDYFIGDLTATISSRSHGALSIVFPYGAIYRIYQAGYILESGKRNAPDGRLRQYYRITDAGRVYLDQLLATYRRFSRGVEDVLTSGGNEDGN